MKTFSLSVKCETISGLISAFEAAAAHAANNPNHFDGMAVDESVELEDEASATYLSLSRIE